MKRTLLASVAFGLAGLMTWGCGSASTGILGGAGPIVAPFSPTLVNYNIFAVTEAGNLISFRLQNPNLINTNVPLTGLNPGERVLGIDFRPKNEQLYAVTSQGRVCFIDTATGVVHSVNNAPAAFAPVGVGDIDFNPQADRIRFVSTANQNIRLHPDTGALVAADPDVFFAADEPPGDPELIACAYTGNTFNSPETALFSLDRVRAIIYGQKTDNPNMGQLTRIVRLIEGTEVGPNAGFDVTDNNTGILAIANSGSNQSFLFTVDIPSRTVLTRGPILHDSAIVSLSAQPLFGQTVVDFVGVDRDNRLVRFDSSDPTLLKSSVAITGLVEGTEVVVGCDFRPADNSFVIVTRNPAQVARTYSVDLATGIANPIAQLLQPDLVNNALLPVDGFQGVDFNPTVDRLRTVSSTSDADPNFRDNYRTNLGDGSTIQDGRLAFAAGDANEGNTPSVAAAAYTNSFPGSTSTRLFVIDFFNNVLCLQNPANNGTLQTVGVMDVDVDEHVNFDISDTGKAFVTTGQKDPNTNANDPTLPSVLCSIDLASGKTAALSNIGGTFLRGFAIVPRGL